MYLKYLALFAVGAVVGYGVVFYYAELLWVRGPASHLVATSIIAPAGAMVFGILSALFVRAAGIFAAATVAGYFLLLFSWVAYASVFDIADREGGKAMAVVFIIAPAVGAASGLIAVVLLSHRRFRRTRRPAEKR